jgi:hypothetical protein
MIKSNVKAAQILWSFGGDSCHQLLRSDALGLGLEHNGGAMGVICSNKMYGVPSHTHRSDPDVGLDVLHDVADMERSVGVR